MDEQIEVRVEKTITKPTRHRFNYLDSAMACVAFIILQILFELIYGNLPLNVRQNLFVALLASFLVEAIFVIAVIITSKINNVKFFEATTLNKKVDFVSVLIAIAMSLICLFCFTGLTNVFVNFLGKLGYKSSSSFSVPNIETYLLYIFLICICPAIFEDVLFRGCILNGLRKLGDKNAVIISAVIFMLMHGGPDQTVHQFILGVVLGFALIASKSVWIPIIIHFVNNFIALTSAYLTRNIEVSETPEISWAELGISSVYSIVMALIGAYFIYQCVKFLKKRNSEKENKDEQTEENKDVEIIDNKEQTLSASLEKTEKEIKENKLSKILFILSGVYLVVNWIFALIGGFL